MSQPYNSLPEAIALNDTPPERKRSLSMSSASGSDISYNDPLDVEPFDEKRGDSRFQDEPILEEGDESAGFVSGTRRVRIVRGSYSRKANSAVTTTKTIKEDTGCLDWDFGIRGWNRSFVSSDICWTRVLGGAGEQAHDYGSYI